MVITSIYRGLLIALLLPSLADAGSLVTRGSVSCGNFVKDREARRISVIWALGFVTASNYAEWKRLPKQDKEVDLLDGADADAIELWLVNYCTKQPLTPLWFAAGELVGLRPD